MELIRHDFIIINASEINEALIEYVRKTFPELQGKEFSMPAIRMPDGALIGIEEMRLQAELAADYSPGHDSER